jgi:hypothetical protein
VSGSIRLSEKHGVNPSLLVCPVCGKDSGVALLGHMPGDAEAPHKMLDHTPCDECQDYMSQGVILISVDESKTTDPKSPYRSGGWVVVREEAATRMFKSPMLEDVLRMRVAYITDDAWDQLGLPRGEVPS